MNLNPINYYNPIIIPDQNPTSAAATMHYLFVAIAAYE
jgi:hypothetical protein